jgi:hypothetical protein
MRLVMWNECISQFILNLDTTWWGVVRLTPQAALWTEKTPSVPLNMGVCAAEPDWELGRY